MAQTTSEQGLVYRNSSGSTTRSAQKELPELYAGLSVAADADMSGRTIALSQVHLA